VRAVVQRVGSASVLVGGDPIATIGPGLCVFVGVDRGDDTASVAKLADKLWNLRVFDDDRGLMNRSVSETGRDVLIVSQFTLYADTSRGRRPSFSAAAPPEIAEPLVVRLVEELSRRGAKVASGRFGADMDVGLSNDGPVTVILET
jgi:D-aminoacyl-tRNA deacylase